VVKLGGVFAEMAFTGIALSFANLSAADRLREIWENYRLAPDLHLCTSAHSGDTALAQERA